MASTFQHDYRVNHWFWPELKKVGSTWSMLPEHKVFTRNTQIFYEMFGCLEHGSPPVQSIFSVWIAQFIFFPMYCGTPWIKYYIDFIFLCNFSIKCSYLMKDSETEASPIFDTGMPPPPAITQPPPATTTNSLSTISQLLYLLWSLAFLITVSYKNIPIQSWIMCEPTTHQTLLPHNRHFFQRPLPLN